MNRLRVSLGSTAVGLLERRKDGGWQLHFEDVYLADPLRPVLGQTFEHERLRRPKSRIPAFFSNLLPEGALRDLVARPGTRKMSQPSNPAREEPELLARLGGDLPGAVIVTLEHGDEVDEPTHGHGDEMAEALPAQPWKFSLAGVQLKFSALREDRRLTIPVGGQGGDWILKVPSPFYPALPANELSMLEWARRSGIEVPDCGLVGLDQVSGLPAIPGLQEGEALVIRRFDREPGRRIHQEDFAQVFNVYPEQKYGGHNTESLARSVLSVGGEADLQGLVQRLVFNVLCGNGDAHLKNWALLYPDGRQARLAPAYDLVFTRAYLPNDDLALNLGGTKRFQDISFETFRSLGEKIAFDAEQVERWAREAAERMRTGWSELRAELPMPEEMKKALERHLESVRL